MKSLQTVVLLLFFFVNTEVSSAQTSGIASGKIYTIASKSTNQLLEIGNASIQNGASVNCWPDTKSDAQRWIVTHIGEDIYTLTNVASGKLLHVTSTPENSVMVDQYDDPDSDDVNWIITDEGANSFALKPVANASLSLDLLTDSIAHGTRINLSNSSSADSQKWLFRKETSQDVAPSGAIADEIFKTWYTHYNIEACKGFFWDTAEMMEIVLDAYEVTRDEKYIAMFEKMYDNFIAENREDWMYNNFNDDIAWAVLFCVRGYLFTGNITYLDKGKEQFDKMYARAFTNTYGGGLNWYETKTSKNACINGPAMVASCYLAQATGDSTYYDKAIALYTWSKVHLFDAATGKVFDNIDLDIKTGQMKSSSWSSTYNQGTYLGAAVMLYNYTKQASYLSEAEKIAQYTRDVMYNGTVINNEDGGNDLPGFKGIFARYARMYTIETNKSDLVDWLLLNAKVAYNNRNSQNLIQTKWGTRTPEVNPKSAFGSSTAVSLLINTLPLK